MLEAFIRVILRIFLDTEFTDFLNPKLISIGLVSEDGREFYAELIDGWWPKQCSMFVVEGVLPCLDRSATCTMSRAKAAIRLMYWLSQMGKEFTVVSDVPVDWLLMSDLLRQQNSSGIAIHHQVLVWPGAAMARHYQLLLEETLEGDQKRHHSLIDARALHFAVVRTEADFRK